MATPHPTPTKLRILRGNPGKRPLNMAEPIPPAVESMPTPPKWIGNYGAEKWNELGPMLSRLGVLTEADLGAFAILCSHWEEQTLAKIELQKGPRTLVHKTGNVGSHPAYNRYLSSSKGYLEYAARFGLTPSDRSRVKADGNKDKESALAKLIRETKETRKAK